MRIGLFGGSFNPIHIGHIKLAKYAIFELKLDKLIFIPAFKSLEKLNENYEDEFHRCRMIDLVIFKNTEISYFELDEKYPVPSFKTIEHFSKIYPKDELFFLIGNDNLETLETWEGIEIIDSLSKITIFNRYEKFNNVTLKKCVNAIWINNPIFDFSSTNFKKGNQNIVDPKVLEYIKKNRLYFFK